MFVKEVIEGLIKVRTCPAKDRTSFIEVRIEDSKNLMSYVQDNEKSRKCEDYIIVTFSNKILNKLPDFVSEMAVKLSHRLFGCKSDPFNQMLYESTIKSRIYKFCDSNTPANEFIVAELTTALITAINQVLDGECEDASKVDVGLPEDKYPKVELDFSRDYQPCIVVYEAPDLCECISTNPMEVKFDKSQIGFYRRVGTASDKAYTQLLNHKSEINQKLVEAGLIPLGNELVITQDGAMIIDFSSGRIYNDVNRFKGEVFIRPRV